MWTRCLREREKKRLVDLRHSLGERERVIACMLPWFIFVLLYICMRATIFSHLISFENVKYIKGN